MPSAQPLDLDGDGIDDGYELRHRTFLNPFNPADADEGAQPAAANAQVKAHCELAVGAGARAEPLLQSHCRAPFFQM